MGTKKSALERRDEEKASKAKQLKELGCHPEALMSDEEKAAESKLSPEEKERRAIHKAIEIKYDIHTDWLEKLVQKTLEDPIKKQLLSKFIDMDSIDGNSLCNRHGLLPNLYKLFFEWPKKLNKAQQQALDDKEKKSNNFVHNL